MAAVSATTRNGAQPAISGGGELIDQGSHLIDLSRWFLGEFTTCTRWRGLFSGRRRRRQLLSHVATSAGQVAWLHATWTEWKNMFSFEIYGRDGKLAIDGLGGSTASSV